MLNAITKTSNYSAISSIDNGTVMYMSASVGPRGEVNFAENIVDYDTYMDNKEEIDSDLVKFKDEVLKK